MPRPQVYQGPPAITPHPLETDRSWFAIVVPIARTNLVTNPSAETNATGWAGYGSTAIVDRVTTQQYHGLYSLQCSSITPGDSAGYNGVSLTSGTIYAVSIKVLAPVANATYELQVHSTVGVILARYRFRSTGRWQWIWLYYKAASTATHRVHLATVDSAQNFFVDGLQVEAIAAGELVSTYIDGDQLGLVPNQFPVPFGWNGTPHASTSYRTGQTRAGGYVVPLNKFGFLLLAILGLGMVPPSIIQADYVQLDGAQFERIQKSARQFTLAGRIDARSAGQYNRQRGDLEAFLDRDLVGQQQPLVLLYQQWKNDQALTDLHQIVAAYAGGLEGQYDNYYAEETSLVFRQFLPAIVSDQESGVSLTPNVSVTNVNRIALRTAAGAWQAIGTGATGGSVYTVVKGLDGKYYIAGDFTLFGGVANTVRICSYDPVSGTIAALGTGTASGIVLDLQVAPNGYIWAVGTFANMGGVAAADFVAYWDGSVWAAPGTPPTLTGTFLQPGGGAFGADGSFYVAAGAGTVVSKWNGSAWSTIGTAGGGGSNSAQSIVRAPDGNIVVGLSGVTPTIGAASGSGVYKYNVSAGTWSGLGSYVQAFSDLEYDAAGNLYGAGGASLWRYSGNQWTQIVTTNNLTGRVTVSPVTNLVLFGGNFTTANSFSPPDSFGVWNGGSVVYPDIDLPGTAGTTIVTLVRAFADGALIVALDASGTATAAASTTVTNTGTLNTYPIVVVKGPISGTARLYNLTNATTGRAIYFNLTLNAGETAILNFDPRALSFLSDFQGDIASSILSGSNTADFFVQPGANVVTFLSASSTITVLMRWHNQYASLNQLTL